MILVLWFLEGPLHVSFDPDIEEQYSTGEKGEHGDALRRCRVAPVIKVAETPRH